MTASVTTDVIAYLRAHPNVRIGSRQQRFNYTPPAAPPAASGVTDATRPVHWPGRVLSTHEGAFMSLKLLAVGCAIAVLALLISMSGAVILAPLID